MKETLVQNKTRYKSQCKNKSYCRRTQILSGGSSPWRQSRLVGPGRGRGHTAPKPKPFILGLLPSRYSMDVPSWTFHLLSLHPAIKASGLFQESIARQACQAASQWKWLLGNVRLLSQLQHQSREILEKFYPTFNDLTQKYNKRLIETNEIWCSCQGFIKMMKDDFK